MIKWTCLLVGELVAFGLTFVAGMKVEATRPLAPAAADRYEMHVTPAAEIIRLDKTTGALHVLTATGEIRDLP